MRGPVKLLLAVALVLAVGGVGAALLLAARGDDAPSPVALESATNSTPPAGVSDQAGGTGAAGAGSPDGTWRVQAGGDSFVGYRIREQLAFLSSPNDAVGRTPAVTGTMRVAQGCVEAATIEADLQALASDEARRDNALRRAGLETARFPTATFELTEPLALDGTDGGGQTLSGEASGRLTVHGTTRDVTVGLQGRWGDGDTIEVIGTLPVTLADFGITPPRLGPVVSVEETATVELQLVFARA